MRSDEGLAVSFGLTLPQRGVHFGALTFSALLELAQAADGCPLIDTIWVGDSLTDGKVSTSSLTCIR